MSLIAFLILGALVGWAAARVMGRDTGVIMNIVIGIVGSFIGSYVSRLFTGGDSSYLAFSWVGLFWSFVGAVILVAIMNALSRRRHHTTV